MPDKDKVVVVGLVGGWVILLLGLFWVLFWRQISVFDPDGMYTTANAEQYVRRVKEQVEDRISVSESIVITHFLDPKCPCYRFAKVYVTQLIEADHPNIYHQISLKEDDHYWADKNVVYSTLSHSEMQYLAQIVPSTPAVLITSSEHSSVSYFGPHSDGILCGQGKGYVPMVVNNLRHGFNPNNINMQTVGCFCTW